MNVFGSLSINSKNENSIINKSDSKHESLKIKLQSSPIKNSANSELNEINNNNLEKSNLKINFELLNNNINNNDVKNQKNIIINSQNQEKKNISLNNNCNINYSQSNNIPVNNIINNQESSLKIKIPFDIFDNHPIFLVQRIDEKNKNCNYYYLI